MSIISQPLKYLKEVFKDVYDSLAGVLRVTEVYPVAYDQTLNTRRIMNVFYTIRSDKDNHFTLSVTNGNSENENLAGLASNKIKIKRVKCIYDGTAFAFDITFWQKDTFQNADLDLDTWAGMVEFLATDGKQINSGSYAQYYYDSGELDITYEDLDGTYELHTALVCRDATNPKVAGANFVLIVDYEIMG